MKNNNYFKKICVLISTLILLWAITGVIDFFRVNSFEKPIFARLDISTAKKDGGSGAYRGLGYYFEIKGNFMPEDEFPGITEYKYYLFGNLIQEGLRD